MQSLDTFFPNLCASQSSILILAYQANSFVKVVFTKFAIEDNLDVTNVFRCLCLRLDTNQS